MYLKIEIDTTYVHLSEQIRLEEVVWENGPYRAVNLISGEMETDEQDDESSQDQELPSENDNSQSEDSVGGDNDLENGVGPENTTKGQQPTGHKKRLFTFQFNNMGKTDLSFIKEEPRQIRFDEGHFRLSGMMLRLTLICHSVLCIILIIINQWHSDWFCFILYITDRSYLSLDWEPEMKKKYFDESLVEVNDWFSFFLFQSVHICNAHVHASLATGLW